MLTGLVSVTFRKLTPEKIVYLAKEAGLDGIEWGGDIHCPPGDIQTARKVGALTRGCGLTVISYGSYYRAGLGGPFEQVLESAIALGTENIRIWAGETGSAQANRDDWIRVTEEARKASDMAAARGISVSFEYHGNTLTDSLPSAERLLAEVGRENVFTYWQPHPCSSAEDNVWSVRRLVELKKLKNLHVFSWEGDDRMPLAHSEERWRRCLSEAAPSDPALLLEFVKGDDPSQMLEDAQTLIRLRQGI